MNEPPNVSTAPSLPVEELLLLDDRRPSAPDTDARLVAAARDGDERAFEALYRLYARMVHGILLARVPRGQVDDLVQDVFAAAWQRLGSLRNHEAFGGWLASIARNRATDYHRHAVDTVELDEREPGAGRASIEAAIDAGRALAAIRSLPMAYRETLVLRLVEGLSGPEIAAQTGLTAASVRVNLHRGMGLLRRQLGIETHREQRRRGV